MTLLDQLLRLENLFWAWEKAQASYSFDKTWYDEIELIRFGANLKANLNEIRSEFALGTFKLSPAKAVAFPKRGESADDLPTTRQMFSFSVRDQVAWIALANVIGPVLDRLMPSWSYGDRLYRSVWRTRDTTPSAPQLPKGPLSIGPFRHSSKHLYRPFKYAWPRYRRHLYLTVNVMATSDLPDWLTVQDQEILEEERKFVSDRIRVPYLSSDYWQGPRSHIYWAGLDLRRFFPTTPTSLIASRLLEGLREGEPTYGGELDGLIQSMLLFPLDLTGWSLSEIEDDLKIGADERGYYSHLPTGLLVAGFLANAAMLEVDREVSRRLRVYEPEGDHQIAQFRYVDDHVVLSSNPDQLLEWLTSYEEILKTENGEWSLNESKLAPEEVKAFVQGRSEGKALEDLRKVVVSRPLDSRFPKPLLSHTLTKISLVAATRFELLDDEGQGQFIQDLEMLLLADFGKSEVRADTRASFAASVLARSAPHLRQMTSMAWHAISERQACQDRLAELTKESDRYKDGYAPHHVQTEQNELENLFVDLVKQETSTRTVLDNLRARQERRIFGLILDAIGRFPDKIRLWQTAVQYCARTGHRGLSELFELTANQSALHKLTRHYVVAVILHSAATEAVRAIRRLVGDFCSPEEREAASDFLSSLPTDLLAISGNERWYELRAKYHLTCAGWAGNASLRRMSSSDLLDQLFEPVLKALSPLILDVRFTENAPQAFDTGGDAGSPTIADIGLWLDDSLSDGSDKPCAVWYEIRDSIGFTTASERAFQAKYPSEVKVGDLVRIAAGEVHAVSDNEGWYYDSIRFGSVTEIERLMLAEVTAKRRSPDARRIRAALRAGTARKNYLRLDEWTDWLRDYPASGEESLERSSDPRLTEWTALIVIQSVAKLLAPLEVKMRNPVHPSSILVPTQWIHADGSAPGGLSWAEWRALMLKNRVMLSKFVIDDERYMGPGWRLGLTENPDWPWVRSCGLVLLGLLRKSFTWPAAWNPDYLQNSTSSLGRNLISQLHCSSRTAGILEATLMPRARENVVRKAEMAGDQFADDTTFDPPNISTLEQLQGWIALAVTILEKSQMSGRQNRARQLIPVNLRQLTRPEWSTTDGNIDEDEDA